MHNWFSECLFLLFTCAVLGISLISLIHVTWKRLQVVYINEINIVQIADDIKPNAVVISILSALSRVIPSWKVIPTQDIIDVAFKVPEVREQVYIYTNFNYSIN